MLRLNIPSVPEGLSHQEMISDPAEWGEVLESGHLEAPVRLVADITRKGQDLYLKGKATVRAVLECARCLEEFQCDLEASIALWIMIREDVEEIGPEERENVVEVRGGTVYADLTDHVRTELLLQVPLKQLCKPDCKGLCPKCGTDLNKGQCTCKKEIKDSRWEALKDLTKDL
jgi:uncharacterized protein